MARARKEKEKNRSAKIKKRNVRDVRTVFFINNISIYISFQFLFHEVLSTSLINKNYKREQDKTNKVRIENCRKKKFNIRERVINTDKLLFMQWL